jgi:hypothetical protein
MRPGVVSTGATGEAVTEQGDPGEPTNRREGSEVVQHRRSGRATEHAVWISTQYG